MDLGFLAQGAAIGFSIAAPVGPIGVLCIRRTLAHGRRAGFVSGLGAATADAVYGGVAGFGLTAVASILVHWAPLLQAAGGVFLLYLGIRALRRPAGPEAGGGEAAGMAYGYFSTFLLTLTNPMTILSFAAIFAGLGIGTKRYGYGAASLLVAGVFLGSAAWWLVLSTVVAASRGRLGLRGLRWANLAAGLVLVGFGLAALASSVL